MIKITNTTTTGWEHAIRGMRNPMNSWGKMDSTADKVGENDLNLMRKLAKAGTDHRKFMRMINVYMDIEAPLYWWKEFDTYKVGTTANSCSTMHKIHAKEFTLGDFSCEQLVGWHNDECWGEGEHRTCVDIENIAPLDFSVTPLEILDALIIPSLNQNRKAYNETKNKLYWHQMIQLLPSSYNQLRTVQLNYEVLANMYHARKNHKLDEWREFCETIEQLEHSELITGKENE